MSQPLLELRFRAVARELTNVRAAVKEQALAVGCNDAAAIDIVMAVDEACQNIIRHAYGKERDGDIVLRIERQKDELVFSLTDYAPRIDPSKVKPRDLDDVRRLEDQGIHRLIVAPPTGDPAHIREAMEQLGERVAPVASL